MSWLRVHPSRDTIEELRLGRLDQERLSCLLVWNIVRLCELVVNEPFFGARPSLCEAEYTGLLLACANLEEGAFWFSFDGFVDRFETFQEFVDFAWVDCDDDGKNYAL